MTKKEFILEVGTEEIPARMVKLSADDLTKHLLAALKAARFTVDEKKVRTLWTPRRVVVCISDLDERQVDLDKEVMGPPVRIAVGPDGKPTKAGESFAKTSGVPFEKIGRKETPKGEVLCARMMEKGRPAVEILAEAAPAAIAALKFKKSMKWGNYDAFFVRPVRWICAVFGGGEVTPPPQSSASPVGGEVVPFAYGAVKSGDLSWGLRLHKDPIKVVSFDGWQKALESKGVIADPVRRKQKIVEGLDAIAKGAGGAWERDEGLLDEVTNLVECPVPFLGTFDAEFLDLPPELLKMTMKHHQRYFPVMKDGRITNHFIGVSNTPMDDLTVVAAGNGRVLRARLKDAQFFYNEDRKKPLAAFVEKLKGVMFQAKLGSYFDKTVRVRALAGHIAGAMNPGDEAFRKAVDRAAELCKADLVTGMVGEFPELQGTMGRYYANHSSELTDVAIAIEEHYRPLGADGALPVNNVGTVIAIADKLDTITGCFSADLKPTGSADPYALRRAALGIIRIILDFAPPRHHKVLRLNLEELIAKALAGHRKNDARDTVALELRKEIVSFFRSRLRAMLVEQARADVVDAFLAADAKNNDLHDLVNRFNAFSAFQKDAGFEAFATSFKRAQNISKDVPRDRLPDPSLYTDVEERALHQAWQDVRVAVDAAVHMEAYGAAMDAIGSGLREPLSLFFSKVFVEVDDPKVRDNRKALLKQIVMLFADFADFSKMEFKAARKD